MEEELSNSELDVSRITKLLLISRTKLYYKIKGLTGETPSNFFRTYKLNRAAELLKSGEYTVSEIANKCGFSTQSHFSVVFKKQFGVTPTEYKGQGSCANVYPVKWKKNDSKAYNLRNIFLTLHRKNKLKTLCADYFLSQPS